MIEGGVVIRNVQIAASAVLPFGDDQVDRTFDVGVVLMNGCSDIAVGDGAAEVIGEAPLTGQAFLNTG